MATQELDAAERAENRRSVPRGVTLAVSGELYRGTPRSLCKSVKDRDGNAPVEELKVRFAGQRTVLPRQ